MSIFEEYGSFKGFCEVPELLWICVVVSQHVTCVDVMRNAYLSLYPGLSKTASFGAGNASDISINQGLFESLGVFREVILSSIIRWHPSLKNDQTSFMLLFDVYCLITVSEKSLNISFIP